MKSLSTPEPHSVGLPNSAESLGPFGVGLPNSATSPGLSSMADALPRQKDAENKMPQNSGDAYAHLNRHIQIGIVGIIAFFFIFVYAIVAEVGIESAHILNARIAAKKQEKNYELVALDVPRAFNAWQGKTATDGSGVTYAGIDSEIVAINPDGPDGPDGVKYVVIAKSKPSGQYFRMEFEVEHSRPPKLKVSDLSKPVAVSEFEVAGWLARQGKIVPISEPR